jgi:mannose-6-phosphate isomerase-like protein (cupin superfamily)
MTIGEKKFVAKSGDTFLIPKGHFHRVENVSDSESCAFTCIFEKYDRSGDEATY